MREPIRCARCAENDNRVSASAGRVNDYSILRLRGPGTAPETSRLTARAGARRAARVRGRGGRPRTRAADGLPAEGDRSGDLAATRGRRSRGSVDAGYPPTCGATRFGQEKFRPRDDAARGSLTCEDHPSPGRSRRTRPRAHGAGNDWAGVWLCVTSSSRGATRKHSAYVGRRSGIGWGPSAISLGISSRGQRWCTSSTVARTGRIDPVDD